MSLDLIKDCVFALLPQCESYKNKEDRNTGYAPLFNGSGATASINGTMTNMGTGYGYDASEGEYVLTVDDHILLNSLSEINSVSNFAFYTRIYFDNIAVTNVVFRKYINGSNYIQIYTASGSLNIDIFSGDTARAVLGSISSYISNGVYFDLAVLYNGAGSTNEDKLKIFINDDEKTLSYTGTIPTQTPALSTAEAYIGYTSNTINGGLKLFVFTNTAKDSTWVSDLYSAGPDLGGLRGIPYSDGTMSFLEERIGLLDTHKNIFSLISSADPRTSDDNTQCFIYSPDDSVTGTMNNFGTGYGFIAESGGVPAHYSGDGVDDEIVLNNSSFDFTNNGTKSFRVKFKLNNTGVNFFAGYYNLSTNANFWIGTYDTQLNLSIFDGSVGAQYIGTTVLSVGVWYDAFFVKNGTTVSIYLNGDVETLTVNQTMPSNPVLFSNYSLFTRTNSASRSNLSIEEFQDFSDAKSADWIKEQYYSAKNEWHGDLTGVNNLDGTMSLSAEYEYLDAQQCWLDYENFVVNAKAWNTGIIGQWKRQVVGYVDEILARWDVSSYSTSANNIESTRILMYCDGQGTNASSATSNIYEQNQTISSLWSNGEIGPPLYDDFGIYESWDTTLDSTTVQTSGVTYEFTDSSGNIKNLVKEWINETKDQSDGVIIDADYGAISYYNDIFSIKLGIKLSAQSNNTFVPFFIINYLNQCI